MATSGPARKNYRQLSQELDEIIDWFESGELNIDEAVPKYEAAMKLITELEKYLKTSENKVRKINARFK